MNKLHNPLKDYGGIRCLFLCFIQSVGIIVTRECIAQKHTISYSIVTGVQSTFTLIFQGLERAPPSSLSLAKSIVIRSCSDIEPQFNWLSFGCGPIFRSRDGSAISDIRLKHRSTAWRLQNLQYVVSYQLCLGRTNGEPFNFNRINYRNENGELQVWIESRILTLSDYSSLQNHSNDKRFSHLLTRRVMPL